MIRTLLLTALLVLSPLGSGAELKSWSDGDARARILEFVSRVTNPDDDAFVAEDARIAVFDNDGTLWAERPVYFQLLFALDRVKALAPQHPEWQEQQPFRAALENDLTALAAAGKRGLLELVMATHAGMTTAEFEQQVSRWLAEARHPTLGRPYTALVYQPMLELLAYLRANGFKTYIVSGGGIEFMRPWVQEVYGIPPEQVVGSMIRVEYAMREDGPVLLRRPEIDFIDDKAGKPVGIHRFIGRRPILAAGNSDGDLQMLQWTTAGDGPSLGLLIHHTDEAREWAYDRASSVGRLDKALDLAPDAGWLVVDMKDDWNTVFGLKETEAP